MYFKRWRSFVFLYATISTISDCCNVPDDLFSSIKHISTIIETLRWRNVFIFYDTDEDKLTSVVDTLRTNHGYLLVTVYDVTEMDQTSIYQLFIRIYPTDNTEFHAILVLQNTTTHFLKTVDNVDNVSNKTTNYQTNSKWILSTTGDPKDEMLDLKLQLKHVIVLYDYQTMIDPFGLIHGLKSVIKCLKIKSTDLLKLDDSQNTTGVDKQMKCTATELYPNSNFKLNGRHLLIGTAITEFFQHKIIENLADILAEQLNFTYTFVQPQDFKYGGKANGVWQGLVGQLVRTEVDLVLADFTITKERLEVIDYILPAFSSQCLGVLYLKAVETESSWIKIFRPLHHIVYICIVGTILFVGLFLFILQKLETNENGSTSFRVEFSHFANTIIFLISFVCVRGNGIWPNAASTRILVSFFWMFCVVITGVYVGNLTAKLSETKTRKPFNSLEELVDLPNWKWGLNGGSLNQKYVQDSNAELLKSLWNGIVRFNKTDPTVLHSGPEFHINRLMKPAEKYAFITMDPKYYVFSRNDCLLESVEGVISALQLAIGIPKSSYLKADLERIMWKLSDNGFLKLLHDIQYKDNRPSTCKTVDKNRVMTFEDMKGVLLVICFGIVLSVIVLVMEYFQNRLHQEYVFH
ncbi:hypothetical protein SNE40_003865 [Patella caerulea]|uniref:Uncharacterized protein n=1 Tax=Patella caerulea TaxID=87958 RepID=A0AAN8KF08_PATCE